MLLGLGDTPEKRGRRAARSSSVLRQFQILQVEDSPPVFFFTMSVVEPCLLARKTKPPGFQGFHLTCWISNIILALSNAIFSTSHWEPGPGHERMIGGQPHAVRVPWARCSVGDLQIPQDWIYASFSFAFWRRGTLSGVCLFDHVLESSCKFMFQVSDSQCSQNKDLQFLH